MKDFCGLCGESRTAVVGVVSEIVLPSSGVVLVKQLPLWEARQQRQAASVPRPTLDAASSVCRKCWKRVTAIDRCIARLDTLFADLWATLNAARPDVKTERDDELLDVVSSPVLNEKDSVCQKKELGDEVTEAFGTVVATSVDGGNDAEEEADLDESLSCSTEDELAAHKKQRHLHPCPQCTDVFPTKRAFVRHFDMVHKATVACHVCGKFVKKLQQHLEYVHLKLGKYPCDVCGEKFVTQARMEKHACDVHGVPHHHMCEQCGLTFPSNVALCNHRAHHGGAVCPICSKVIKGTGHHWLQDHIDGVHKRIKKYPCDMCGESFMYRSQVLSHKVREHNVQKRQYPCTLCGKVFSYKRNLRTHSYKEHGVVSEKLKLFRCEACGKEFANTYALRRHEATHSSAAGGGGGPNKPHSCPHCDHKTAQFESLKVHIKSKHNRDICRVLQPNGDYVIEDAVVV
ncbi:unnamed protein product [Notodromas monacha]|uniref:C2H2-type domain-containing protein n=1 Tax=Notodromas monacha TaxID=399045 RepID=A0A7R9G9V5_9CRUS|nr:unnamed protein product [Notodromas monacha]CAG0913352.1 unnamed protein product [Notodromas monacha]